MGERPFHPYSLDDDYPWDEYEEMFAVGDDVRHQTGSPFPPKKWVTRLRPSANHRFIKPAREEIFWRWRLDGV